MKASRTQALLAYFGSTNALILYLYRQYFENSRVETAFIGYSSEMTALTVRQATDDTAKDREDDDYWDFTVCLYSH